jgi:hypothetical protein
MRTTVTLDPDVDTLLRKEMRRQGQPFKQVLNNAIRAGLRNAKPRDEDFVPLVFDMGKPRGDLAKAAALADSQEDEGLGGRYRRNR